MMGFEFDKLSSLIPANYFKLFLLMRERPIGLKDCHLVDEEIFPIKKDREFNKDAI